MAKELDVYRDWLNIKEPQRPLNYYQLLHLEKFEDDVDRIRRHYRKLNAHVRKYATGKFAKESQKLLNELARARLCLTDAERKAEYDASLGRRKVEIGERESMEHILLRRNVIDSQQLQKSRQLAAALGIGLRDALLQQKTAPIEAIMQAYADSLGMPFLDLADIAVDESLIPRVSAVLARKHSLAPVLADGRDVLLVSPHPIDLNIEEDLRLRLGRPVRTVLCTTADINRLIAEYYPQKAAEAEVAARASAPAEEPKKQEAPPQGLLGKFRHWLQHQGRR